MDVDTPSGEAGEEAGTRAGNDDRLRDIGSVLLIGSVIVVLRTYIYGAVFRKGDVVLLANDPYFYRYLVENLVAAADGVTDVAALTSQTKTAPLLIAVLGWLAELAGGTPAAAGTLSAWYPVVAAVATGGLAYAATARLTGIRWAGIAAGLTIAIMPIHVVRTALGFADHHAFDYGWLALTLLALVVLADTDDASSRAAWLAAGGLGLGLAGQVLSWVGGIILLVPLGIYAQYRALLAVRTGVSPLRENALLIGGIGTGVVLVVLAHVAFGWHPRSVAFAPVGLLVGVLGLFVAGEVARHTSTPTPTAIGIETVGLVLGGSLVFSLHATQSLVNRGREYVALIAPSDVVEGSSMLGGPWGIVTGPFSLFGLLFVLALPYLVVATWRVVRGRRPAWAVPVIYTWYFVGAALLQRRFAGELSVVVAPIVGAGLISITSQLGVLRPLDPFGERERPLRLDLDVPLSRVYLLAVLLVLVASASFVQIPLKMNQATYDAAEHDAARWMRSYADEHGLEYPQNYVLSWWSENRMYNYFVSYHSVPSLRYSYARSNYAPFMNSASPTETYERYRDRVGFIVTTDSYRPSVRVVNGSRTRSLSMYARLHERLTSRGDGVPGLAHYRTLWVSEDASVKVFTLVPGATVTGTAAPNTTVAVSTDVSLEHTTVTYRRVVETNATGAFSVTVPYPGTYAVGNATVVVSESDVTEGRTVTVSSG